MQIRTQSRPGSWWRLGAFGVALAASGVGSLQAQERGWVEVGNGYSPAPAVRATQYLLREHGHAVAVDGSYGSQTRERVRRFQRARGLEESGVVSGVTWERLVVPVRRGSRGNAVRAVQSLLRAYAGSAGDKTFAVALDGVFSAQTDRAVRRIQRLVSITPDGLVGPVTWNKLILVACEH